MTPILVALLFAASTNGSGTVCVLRREDGGSMNIHAVRLIATQESGARRDLGSLIGGESACVKVDSGVWSVRAFSRRPYDPEATDARECKSIAVPVEVVPGAKVTLQVTPRSEGASYVCGWVVTAPSNKQMQRTRPAQAMEPRR